MSIGKPQLENRKTQPYLGIRANVSPKELGKALPALHHQLADWMERKGIEPVGALFFRYYVIDPQRGFDVEVGVPVLPETQGDENIRALTLPAGTYATLLHTGNFSGLHDANKALFSWAEKNGIEWQLGLSDGAEAWEARIETYMNVGLEKNPDKWQTEIAILTASD